MRNTDVLSKIETVVNEASEKSMSEWRIQQLFYLLQNSGEIIGRPYTYRKGGVYSEALACDIELAESIGLLQRENHGAESFLKPNGVTNGSTKEDASLSSKACECLRRFADQPAPYLEALTTVLHLSKSAYSREGIFSRGIELRPELSDVYSQAYSEVAEFFGFSE